MQEEEEEEVEEPLVKLLGFEAPPRHRRSTDGCLSNRRKITHVNFGPDPSLVRNVDVSAVSRDLTRPPGIPDFAIRPSRVDPAAAADVAAAAAASVRSILIRRSKPENNLVGNSIFAAARCPRKIYTARRSYPSRRINVTKYTVMDTVIVRRVDLHFDAIPSDKRTGFAQDNQAREWCAKIKKF